MIIKSIRLENIRSYLDEKIEFPEGSVLLSGDIGCGKSSILLALEFALFGLIRGEFSGSDLLRHGKDRGSVEVVLDVDGKEIIIKRTLKRGKGIVQDSGYISVNEEKKEYTASEMKKHIMDMLGYSKESLFRYCVYTPQEQMKEIIFNKDRLDILRKIFDIDKYGRIKDNVKLFLTELRAMKRELVSASSDLAEKENELSESRKKMNELDDKILSEKTKLQDIDKKIDEKKNLIADIEKSIKDLNEIKNNLEKKKVEFNSLETRIEQIKKSLSDINKKISENENELKSINIVKKPEKSEDEIIASINRTEKLIRDNLGKKAVLEEEIRKLSSILEKGICGFCKQKVQDPLSFKKNIETKLKEQNDLMNEIDKLKNNLEALKQEQKKLNEYVIFSERFSGLQKIIESNKNLKKQLESELYESNKKITSLKNEINELEERLKGSIGIEEQYSVIKNALDSLQTEKIEYEKSISRLEQEMHDIKERITSLSAEVMEKKQLKEKIEKIASIFSWFEKDFTILVENIEKNVLLTIQHEFDLVFRKWFSVLIDDENLAARINEEFSPVIEQNGYETEYQNLSGGEKTSVALAYRLALNRVVNELIGNTKASDLIILDEPTDGFSTDQIDKIRDVINELNVRQLIIVSHEPKIDTFVDNVIRIYKENHVSKIFR